MKKHIPNLVTLLNLFCGSIAVLLAVSGHLVYAAFFVFLGIFFDFFDGLLARRLNVQSELGLQLDSLADVVTSGVVPGIVMYQLLNLAMNDGWQSNSLCADELQYQTFNYISLLGLLIILASAYRLAKFNVSDNQSDAFIGLPVPANTLLIMALPLIMEFQNSDSFNAVILNQWFLLSVTLLSCYLLNAKIRLLALKFKNYSFKDNAMRYVLIILAVILLVIFQFAGIPLIILIYIILSLLTKK
ncbi:MAG: CDP-alcohol phosphatidyltransferase family protein [Flavobacteriaceae bacterium]|nr:CDP-alcohol phosphatidyltransferase family protein [Flavobacteriaceae bacterium]